jgi:hypothetical protein
MILVVLIVRYVIRYFLIASFVISMIILNIQCIEEYDPGLNVDADLLTVNASIVRGHEEQTVVITRSTPLDDIQYIAVEDCDVSVSDERGNIFQFEEISSGQYVAEIDDSYLSIGAKFKLTIKTPDDNLYESGYEEIHDCPPVDNLYFKEEPGYSKVLHSDIDGLRLYTDLRALEGYTGYYRWKIHETWEYRSKNKFIDAELVGVNTKIRIDTVEIYPIMEIDTTLVPVPVFYYYNKPDSLQYCWHEAEITELYSSSTGNLITDARKQVPLHHVFGHDERLMVRYSCLVSQYSLSEGAYHYWHNKKVEIQESGGIYFTQPSQTIANIKNVNNEQETILGYFWTSTVKQKRIFYDGPFIPDDYRIVPCHTERIYLEDYFGLDLSGSDKYVLVNRSHFPLYLEIRIVRAIDPITMKGYWDTIYSSADQSCFDCRLQGGTVERPDYW